MDILYIEDSAKDASLVFRVLDALKITDQYHHIEDGESALEYLRHMGTDVLSWPKLILLDIKLPKVDGFEILKVLKGDERLAQIPVVMFSASAHQQDREKAYSLGANSYLVKPNKYAVLKELVNYLGVYWLQKNNVPYE